MTDIKLLPCPFCGGEPEALDLGDDDSHYVHCKDCEVQQIANYRPHVAAKRWNTRVDPVRAEMLAGLKLISEEYANQDLNHVDFRVWAKLTADELIAKAEGRAHG